MGGPPTTSVWTRDGFVVAGTKHGAYSIDLSLSRRRSESTYVSRLTATGYLPGKYEYSVYNEATTRFVRNSFQVDGKLHDGIKILRTIQGGLRSRVKGGRDGSGGILVATHQCTFLNVTAQILEWGGVRIDPIMMKHLLQFWPMVTMMGGGGGGGGFDFDAYVFCIWSFHWGSTWSF